MAYPATTRSGVRSDFIRGLSLAAAADKHQVPYNTARTWKSQAAQKGDDWDTARAAMRISAGGVQELTSAVLEDFVHLFQTTIQELKEADNVQPLAKAEALARLSDAYQKTVKAAGASDPKLSQLSIAMSVLQRLVEFVRKHHPDVLSVFLEMLEPFGEELASESS